MKIKDYEKEREVFAKYNLNFSRMISASKRTYYNENKNNLIIFNARIYDEKTFEKYKNKEIKDFFDGQDIEIWYGDLDLNKDIKVLFDISRELKLGLVITRENGESIIEIKYPDWLK